MNTKPDTTIHNFSDKQTGEFNRQVSSFRDWIGSERFPAEKGRYHLYVSLGCPWAHRTLIVRALKGHEDVISVTVVNYILGPDGCLDPHNNAKFLSEIYRKAEPNYVGRFTVPVLWDTKLHTISIHPALDLYPEELAPAIDEINEWIYNDINNGVYKSGFATKQEAYEKNVHILFNSLDRVEAHLEGKTWLIGDKLTEADVRLFPTILRFDPAYHGQFKCNLKSIAANYPNISVADTVDYKHIKGCYYGGLVNLNPSGIIPVSNGPDLANPKVESDVLALNCINKRVHFHLAAS
ncbi:unnamed protein product [Aphanomyces euteiches]